MGFRLLLLVLGATTAAGVVGACSSFGADEPGRLVDARGDDAIALGGKSTTCELGGGTGSGVITAGIDMPKGKTLTLFVGGYAGTGMFTKTMVTVDRFCADLAPSPGIVPKMEIA